MLGLLSGDDPVYHRVCGGAERGGRPNSHTHLAGRALSTRRRLGIVAVVSTELTIGDLSLRQDASVYTLSIDNGEGFKVSFILGGPVALAALRDMTIAFVGPQEPQRYQSCLVSPDS